MLLHNPEFEPLFELIAPGWLYPFRRAVSRRAAHATVDANLQIKMYRAVFAAFRAAKRFLELAARMLPHPKLRTIHRKPSVVAPKYA